VCVRVSAGLLVKWVLILCMLCWSVFVLMCDVPLVVQVW